MVRYPTLVPTTLLAAGLAFALQASADIYRSVDSAGNTTYSDRQTHAAEPIDDSSKRQVNYYSPRNDSSRSEDQADTADTAHDLAAGTENSVAAPSTKPATKGPLTEAECQKVYGINCDQVINWKKYALEKCGNDERCDDPDYLDRKYRPRPLEEVLAVALKAGNRKNRNDQAIQNYITRKYSNLCQSQLESYCDERFKSNSNGVEQCVDALQQSCEEDQNLGEFLAAYNQLTPVEKQKIIKQAKDQALKEGQYSLTATQLMKKVFDIYLTQYLSGL